MSAAKKAVFPETHMITLYHGSPSRFDSIKDQGLFGGVFASGAIDAAYSHGDVLHEINIPESALLTQSDLNYHVDYNKVVAILKEQIGTVSQEEFDAIYDAVIEDKGVGGVDIPDERLLEIFRCDDTGEAGWEAQRIRGVVAKRLGYKAVEMQDEHGTSYLVLPGADIQPYKNPTALEDRASVVARAMKNPSSSRARRNPAGSVSVLDFLKGSLVGVYRAHEELPDEPDEFHLNGFSSVEKSERDRMARDPQKYVFLSDYLVFSDYTGADVERSNVRVFYQDHGDKPGVYRVHGGHGTTGIAIRLDVSDEGVLDDLARLDNYPVLDEDDMGRASQELADAAAESYGYDDFVREIEERLSVSIDHDRTESGKLAELFWEVSSELSEPYRVETGGLVAFFDEKMAKRVDLERLDEAGIEYEEVE